MKRSLKSKSIAALLAMMLLVYAAPGAMASPSDNTHAASSAPTLGTAANFAVLGATTVTNTGPTILTGDLGVSPGTSCTGFGTPCTGGSGTVTGTIHTADPVAAQAQTDALNAYTFAAAQSCTTTFLPITDIGGLTLTPGVYCFPSSAGVTGTLTLDAQGNPNAAFIFKIGSTLITASASKVVLINGAQSKNVFFQVGSSATLGTTTMFAGSIVALTSITATTGATSNCGLYALNGAVTLDSNNIQKCSSDNSHVAESAPTLGTAVNFAVLGATTVTNTGPTILTGNLGVSPGTSCTGFGTPCTGGSGTVTGTIHTADPVAAQAQTDALNAYTFAAAQSCTTTFLPITDIGGLTLTPGVYCFPSSAGVTGTLTLDAQGNPNAAFIFKIGSTLITASASKVVLINGAQSKNVFFQVGSSATLGTTTMFAGSIVALTSITATTGATSNCGLYALNGAVTLDSNNIQKCSSSLPENTAFSIQSLDACRQAIGETSFQLTGNGLNQTKIVPMGGPKTVSSQGKCPIQHGNCVLVSVGCVSFAIPIPVSGTRTYTLQETSAPDGYVPCRCKTCPYGPEVITLIVNASGKIAATTFDPNTNTTYPTNQMSFAGTQADPALAYDFYQQKNKRGMPDMR